ncbi:MAG: hypothetical protein AB1426_12560 [Bacillota bacterium]
MGVWWGSATAGTVPAPVRVGQVLGGGSGLYLWGGEGAEESDARKLRETITQALATALRGGSGG